MRTEFSIEDENNLNIFESLQKDNNNTTTTISQQIQAQGPFIKGSFKGSNSLYKEEMVIGNGAYGTVYKARDITDPQEWVALKKVRIPLNEDGVPVPILREIALVRQLDKFNHPNIVRFLDVCHGPRNPSALESSLVLFLVFEYVDKDLAKFIQTAGDGELNPKKIKDITYQIINGVDFLHSQRIVHRDLKPQNLLISANGRIKLADFGLAKIYDFTMRLTSVVVTLWYRSPELLLGSSYGTPVDLWSVGCIMAELFRRGHPLFPGESEIDQLEKIMDFVGTVELETEWDPEYNLNLDSFKPRPGRELLSLVPGLDPLSYDLLRKILVFNPKKRFTAADALKHEYFKEYRTASPIVLIPKQPSYLTFTPTISTTTNPEPEQQPPAVAPEKIPPPVAPTTIITSDDEPMNIPSTHTTPEEPMMIPPPPPPTNLYVSSMEPTTTDIIMETITSITTAVANANNISSCSSSSALAGGSSGTIFIA